jgi:hypothetical protein
MPLSPSANHKSPFVISGAIAEMLPSTIKTAPIEMVKTKASQYGGQAAGKCCIDRSLCLRATGYHHRASALRPAKAYQAVLPHNSRLPRRFGRSCSINVSPYLRLSPHVKGGCFLSTPAARSHSRAGAGVAILGSASGLAYISFAPKEERDTLLALLARSGDPHDALARPDDGVPTFAAFASRRLRTAPPDPLWTILGVRREPNWRQSLPICFPFLRLPRIFRLKWLKKMVGATGIEPVTPTMST